MKKIQYDRNLAKELLPLLEAIGREIRERSEALERHEQKIELESKVAFPSETKVHGLVAQAASHRRGLRHVKEEIEQLGCSVVGTEPLTIRIPGRVGEAKHSFVWQTGDLVLK